MGQGDHSLLVGRKAVWPGVHCSSCSGLEIELPDQVPGVAYGVRGAVNTDLSKQRSVARVGATCLRENASPLRATRSPALDSKLPVPG